MQSWSHNPSSFQLQPTRYTKNKTENVTLVGQICLITDYNLLSIIHWATSSERPRYFLYTHYGLPVHVVVHAVLWEWCCSCAHFHTLCQSATRGQHEGQKINHFLVSTASKTKMATIKVICKVRCYMRPLNKSWSVCLIVLIQISK